MSELVYPPPPIETIGITPLELALSKDAIGYSGFKLKEPRENFNPPHGFSVTRLQTQFGPATLIFRPGEKSYHDIPQDALSIQQRGETISLLIADGCTNVGGLPSHSEILSHHLASNIKPITSTTEAQDWLNDLNKGPFPATFKIGDGASTLKLATITPDETGYTLHLTQIGDKKGILLGPTYTAIDGKLREITISSNLRPYYALPTSTDFQTIHLEHNTSLILGSDGLNAFSLMSAIRGPHYLATKLASNLSQLQSPSPQEIFDLFQREAPSNPDDTSLIHIHLK